MRTADKITLLESQRKEHGNTRRIRRSLEATRADFSELKREYEHVDRLLTAALKQIGATG